MGFLRVQAPEITQQIQISLCHSEWNVGNKTSWEGFFVISFHLKKKYFDRRILPLHWLWKLDRNEAFSNRNVEGIFVVAAHSVAVSSSAQKHGTNQYVCHTWLFPAPIQVLPERGSEHWCYYYSVWLYSGWNIIQWTPQDKVCSSNSVRKSIVVFLPYWVLGVGLCMTKRSGEQWNVQNK